MITEISTDSNDRYIELTQGRVAVVDAEDFERLSVFKWYALSGAANFYAARSNGGKVIFMHRKILEAPAGLCCDHIDHDGLNNRRSNLRLCTHTQNCWNRLPSAKGTSRYKGVCWDSYAKKWCAYIGFENRNIHIGYYDYEADAAIAYDDRAIELYGEFACLNSQHRPEIKIWLEQTYLFEPMKN